VKKQIWLALSLAGLIVVAGLGYGVRKILKRRAAMGQPANVSTVVVPRKLGPIERAEALYDGKLGQGWDDWGWGPHELGKGPAKIVFGGYGGILLHHDELSWQYGGVAFRYQAPAEWGEFMHVSLRGVGLPDDAFPLVVVQERHVVPMDGWREVLIDAQELNPEGRAFDRVMIGARSSVGNDPVLIDQIVLTKASASALAATQRKPTLEVLCNGNAHPISELIYAGATDDWSAGVSAKRIGGNPLSRANWETGHWNAGHDWFFENGGQKVPLLDVLKEDARQKHQIAIVVPMLGWVSKDATSCGFPRSKFREQRKFDPYKPDAGDGYLPDGKPITPGDPSQTSIPAPPELIESWVRKVVENSGQGPRHVHMYILDNEPALWNVTHRDVHPQPVGYDELYDRTLKYASVIRAADPQAVIAGPAEWGWINYMTSGVDREAGGVQLDRKKHGDAPLVAWYLRKLAEHEKATGQRLLDYLDLHFYPAAEGMYGGDAKTDAESAAKRIRSTRALWDPTYKDESWIKEAIRLIPRMRDWVRDNYPGRKLSIGEWSFGADAHISGGLATAEALGRFGQQGLDAAFYWGELNEKNANYWAFRAFRNFDGKGGRFLDISLPVKEAESVSLFASRNTERNRLVLVLLNRDASTSADVSITLSDCGDVESARLFGFDANSKQLTPGTAKVTANGVSAVMVPYSFAVLDLDLR